MRRKHTLWLAMAAVLSLTLNPAAAETAPVPLPGHLSAHISIKSANGFVEALDGFLAAVTDGTRNAMPPGLISMVAGMYMPFPMDAWKSDSDLHVLFPAEGDSANGAVVILPVEDFDKFLGALKDNGATIGDDADATSELGGRAASVLLPNMGNLMALDLGEGRLAIGKDAETLEKALRDPGIGSWKAWPHFGDADATVDVSLASVWKGMDLDKAMKGLEEAEPKALADAEGAPVKIRPEVIKGFFAAVRKFLPLFKAEAARTGTLSIDIGINDERLALGFRGASEAGSLMDRIGSALGKLGAVKNDLADRIPVGPVALTVGAPSSDVIPGIRERLGPFVADLVGMPYPAQKAALEKLFADMFAYGDEGKVTASYFDEGESCNATWLRTSNPAALLASMDASFRLVNDILAATAEAPGLGIAFESEKGEADGNAFTRYFLKLADDSPIKKAAGGMDNPEFAKVMELFDSFAIYAGVKDGVAIVVAGQADADDYAGAVAIAGGDKSEAMLDTEAAKRLVGWLPNRQGALVVVDTDRLFPVIAAKIAEMHLSRSPDGESDPYIRALEEAIPDLEEHEEAVGAAMGSVYGQPLVELALPAKALNSLVLAYDVYRGKLDALLGADDSGHDDSEEYQDGDSNGDQGGENGTEEEPTDEADDPSAAS